MDDRTEVLANSLFIEAFISQFVCFILNIKDPNKSKSFSGKTSSLSHFHKVGLLTDIGELTAEEHKIFAYYLEVRNMFMHNFKAITYVSCYELLPESTRNGIRKMYYPDKAKRGKEQQLTPVECKSALKKLGKEALALTGKLIKQPSNHYSLKAKELRDKFENAIMTTINEITTRLDIYFNTAIEKGDNLNPKIFENFGTKLNKQIIKDISIKMGWNRKPIQRPIQP